MDLSQSDSPIHPIPLPISLIKLYHTYQKPLFLSQNALPPRHTFTPHPQIHHLYPIHYLKQHIQHIKQALKQGLDLIPYTPSPSIHLITS
ncbi:family 1 glycosylhydrolase, partial [Bacillus pumilus]|uniref:family 1 glycosylhydrolase n=1 Tax=Bacillus pumilus TaxID=1408 RepID=UPI0034D96D4A